jgi:hypothetical protein
VSFYKAGTLDRPKCARPICLQTPSLFTTHCAHYYYAISLIPHFIRCHVSLLSICLNMHRRVELDGLYDHIHLCIFVLHHHTCLELVITTLAYSFILSTRSIYHLYHKKTGNKKTGNRKQTKPAKQTNEKRKTPCKGHGEGVRKHTVTQSGKEHTATREPFTRPDSLQRPAR